MSNGDQILRCYSLIKPLKDNIPDTYEVSETWVKEYNDALDKLKAATGFDLTEFAVPQERLHRSVAAYNTRAGTREYRAGLWCDRSILLHKIDAVLIYFTGLQSSQEKKIGFDQGE